MKFFPKLVLATLSLFVLTANAEAQLVSRTFSTKTFNTTVNRTDTSSFLRMLDFPYIEVGTSTVGTDSLRLIVNVDYQIGTVWLTGVRDTVKFGPGTPSGTKSKGFVIRNPYTTNVPGAVQIRIRNVLIPFRTADSTSATSYSQSVIFRK
ncbi:MAG: hypothetical protein IT211_11765 [Armatimonadetes bacterium]|nr:hypothetical protein [Armatimonadota bacterium]